MVSAADKFPGMRRSGVGATILYFGGGAILLFLVTRFAIPYASEYFGQEPVIFWFIFAGLGFFLPMLAAAAIVLRAERPAAASLGERLMFRKLSAADIKWTAAGLAATAVFSGAAVFVLVGQFGTQAMHPAFMAFEPLSPGRYWLLMLWFPFWLLNIFGEEILWRGVLLPKQEMYFGKWAWLANAFGWLLLHVPFGPVLMISLLPIVFIVPYVVQRTRNIWCGIILHAALNGPGFLAIAFGLA